MAFYGDTTISISNRFGDINTSFKELEAGVQELEQGINFNVKLYAQGQRSVDINKSHANNILRVLNDKKTYPILTDLITDMADQNPNKFLSYNPTLLALGLSFKVFETKSKNKFKSWETNVKSKIPEDQKTMFDRIDRRDILRYALLWENTKLYQYPLLVSHY